MDVGLITMVPPGGEAALAPEFGPILAARAKAPPLESMAPAEARLAFLAGAAADVKHGDLVGRVENSSVPGPAGPVPVRVYTPPGGGPFPVFVYFHGGGWLVGNLDSHDDICRSLCRRSGCSVVSVDYRLAPEHKFPAPLDDCVAVWNWVGRYAKDLGGDPRRLAVGGDSAGANLAAALRLRVRDRGGPTAALQVLLYPVTNYDFDTVSYRQNAVGLGLTRDLMRHFWSAYLAGPEDGANAYASPLRAAKLSGLPPALVLTAGFDVLRDEGEAYAARLAQAGVKVRATRYQRLIHGFLRYAPVSPDADRGLQEAADALRATFAQ